MLKKIGRLLLVSLLLTALPAISDDEPLTQLKNFLHTTRSLTAHFKQTLLNEAGDPYQTSYGLFYLQRPGKFRWNYTQPFDQQIIATNGSVTFYDADLEQVTIKKLDESIGSTPALLLSGDAALDDNYRIEQQGTEGDMQWIKLAPKNQDSTFKYMLIGLEKGRLSGMQLHDNFGQLTRIYFSKLNVNEAIDKSVFEFTPPDGVDVFSEGNR